MQSWETFFEETTTCALPLPPLRCFLETRRLRVGLGSISKDGLAGLPQWPWAAEDAEVSVPGPEQRRRGLRAAPVRTILSSLWSGLLLDDSHGSCDKHGLDRAANLLTSVPFFWLASKQVTEARDREGRLYGFSLIGVGFASLLFHASSGSWRPTCRKMDYHAIACATTCFLRAARPRGVPSTSLSLAAFGCAPISPLAVAGINGFITEGAICSRCLRYPQLRRHQLLHSAYSALAGIAWLVDDLAPGVPFAHAVWHLAAWKSAECAHYILLPRPQKRGF